MEKNKRTVTCGELSKADAGRTVVLNGWVHRNRDHGGVQFINIRDRYGISQVVVDQDAEESLKTMALSLKFEYCIAVVGVVRLRPDEMINKEMNTGEIEILANEIQILSTSEVLPFMIEEETDAREDLRLKYRFLDLRSDGMQKRIRLRHKVAFSVREFLEREGFYEIETPTFIKSTPEGARDFLVPSRLHPGKFYALPQSPQLYKQMLMVSGFDKYFQIARCYRDEDARGDRQLEFTQIDLEMSFVSREDVFSVTEAMMGHVFKQSMQMDLPATFTRLSYHDAMNTYGSDKPELRFDMKMQDFEAFIAGSDFSVFKTVVENKGAVKALVVPGAAAAYSRKKIQDLEEAAKTYGAKGLAWMKVGEEGLEGGVSKFFMDQKESICKTLGAQKGDLILLMGADWKTACNSLGAVRLKLGKDLGLIENGTFKFCWIIDFPLFEWNEEMNKWDPAHHLFSMPQEKYLDTLESNPGEVKGDLYDLVCNGYELASGSIRVHDIELQKRIFRIVGFSDEESQEKFGFLLDAFRYGAPPHGGIAPGLDRLVMIMAEKESIKEVIAFPKNSSGISPMDDCPADVDNQQLDDLHLKVVVEPDA